VVEGELPLAKFSRDGAGGTNYRGAARRASEQEELAAGSAGRPDSVFVG